MQGFQQAIVPPGPVRQQTQQTIIVYGIIQQCGDLIPLLFRLNHQHCFVVMQYALELHGAKPASRTKE
ncbi:MAG: hypothetical protein SV765_02505 [Pseudomonadota bacterium]|nr:hypothetical protein [Pseudomonadota bacterium]